MNVTEYKTRLAKAPGRGKRVKARPTTLQEYAAESSKPRRSKYGNVKVEADGFVFDSKAEFRRYLELKTLGKAGKIWALIIHPGVDLGACRYSADFSYKNGGVEVIWEDVKGYSRRDGKQSLVLKLRLMKELYGIDVKLLTQETDGRLFR